MTEDTEKQTPLDNMPCMLLLINSHSWLKLKLFQNPHYGPFWEWALVENHKTCPYFNHPTNTTLYIFLNWAQGFLLLSAPGQMLVLGPSNCTDQEPALEVFILSAEINC